MDDWKLKTTPVVRLQRSSEAFVYFLHAWCYRRCSSVVMNDGYLPVLLVFWLKRIAVTVPAKHEGYAKICDLIKPPCLGMALFAKSYFQ